MDKTLNKKNYYAFLNILMDATPDHIYFKDTESRFILNNRASVTSLGLSHPAEAVGKTDFDFFTEEHARHAYEIEQEIIRTGRPLPYIEEKETWPDGSTTWVSTIKMPLRDALGEIIGIFGISRDITERKRAEEELIKAHTELDRRVKERTAELASAYDRMKAEIAKRKQAEETLAKEHNLLRMLIDNLPDHIYVKDTASRFIIANRAIAHHMGAATPDELVGKTDFDFYHRELASKYYNDEQRIIESGRSLVGHEEFTIDQAGDKIWISTTKVPVRDSQGNPLWLVGMNRNIDNRKHMEEALQKSAESQRLLSDRLTHIVHSVNELSKIGSFDDLCRRAVELALEKLGFDRFSIWFFSEDRKIMNGSFGTDETGRLRDERGISIPIVDASVKKLVQSKSYYLLTEKALYNDKGQTIGRGLHAVATLWNGEEVIGFVSADNLIHQSAMTDQDAEAMTLYAISLGHLFTRLRSEQEIKANIREKKILLKEIHHRVKNNMQIIVSLLNLQSAQIFDPQVQARLKESQDRIYSMALVHEMLYGTENLARIDFRQYIQNLVENIWQSHETNIPKTAFELAGEVIELDIEHAVPCGLVVNELFSNTLKHAFPKGWEGEPKIWISLKRIGHEIELIVGDNGIGIPKEKLDGKTQSLGLTLVDILGKEQLNGEINIQRDKGTVFNIRFKS
jgi:PAS domain S-box-containing protein